MFAFDAPRRPRRPSLTPMIDVVFLLLVFFMLAARFGHEAGLDLAVSGAGAGDYSGPPRLVDVAPDAVRLNGVAVAQAELPAALARLSATPSDMVVIRPGDGTDLQRLVDVMTDLRAAGFTGLALVE